MTQEPAQHTCLEVVSTFNVVVIELVACFVKDLLRRLAIENDSPIDTGDIYNLDAQQLQRHLLLLRIAPPSLSAECYHSDRLTRV